LDATKVARARLVAISVPMHTALRLGEDLAQRVRALNPAAHICLFGLYAWMHGAELLGPIADSVIGGEFESALSELANLVSLGASLESPPIAGLTTAGALAERGRLNPPALARVE